MRAKEIMKAALTVAALFGWTGNTARAADGNWNNSKVGFWNDAVNWQDGLIGGGVGSRVYIEPSFAELDANGRYLQLPAGGVTVGKIESATDPEQNQTRLGGGTLRVEGDEPLLQGAGGVKTVVAAPVVAPGDLTVQGVALARPVDCAGTLTFRGDNSVYPIYGAREAGGSSTNFLSEGPVVLQAGASIGLSARGPSGAYQQEFVLTAGSPYITSSAAVRDCAGATVTGEGIPAGTFVKGFTAPFTLEISAAATVGGAQTLSFGAVEEGGALQRFTSLDVQGGGASVELLEFGGALPRLEVGELTSEPGAPLTKNGAGMFAFGLGGGLHADLNVANGGVEISRAVGFTDDLRMTGLLFGNAGVTVPDAAETVTVRRFGTLNTPNDLIKAGAGTLAVEGLCGARMDRVEVTAGHLALGTSAHPLRMSTPVFGAAFHVDAMAPETLDLEREGDVDYVTCWRDVDGGDRMASPHSVRPFISTNYLGGRPVVDFGSFSFPNESVAGYGASLTWSSEISGIREIFMVFSDTEETFNLPSNVNASFLLGHTDDIQFHRGGATKLFVGLGLTSEHLMNALIEVDGVARGNDYVLPPGFHLIHIRTTGGVKANAFARDRGESAGGQRLAEVFVYERELTDAQAASVTEYLNAKWFGQVTEANIATLKMDAPVCVTLARHETLALGDVTASAPLVKRGEGTLRVGRFAGEGRLVVEDGVVGAFGETASIDGMVQFAADAVLAAEAGQRLSLSRLSCANGTVVKTGAGAVDVGSLDEGVHTVVVADGELTTSGTIPCDAFLHVDAQRADTLSVTVQDGVRYVYEWRDADSSGRSAASGDRMKPFISTNYFGGRPVVDFGSFKSESQGVTGYGASLAWSETDNDIREIFMVYSDTEDTLNLPSNKNSQFLLGHTDDIQFHRGGATKLFVGLGLTSESLMNGLIEVDGVRRNYDYALPSGFHLIHLRPTEGVAANTFACDRTYSYGGQRLAEVIVYNRALSDDEVAGVSRRLTEKWWGSGATRALDRLVVAENATADFGEGTLEVAALDGAGTVRVGTLAFHEGATLTVHARQGGLVPLDVEGRVALGARGTVVVAGEPLPKGEARTLTLADCTGVEGAPNASSWKVEGDLGPSMGGRLVVEDGRLVLKVCRLGMSCVIR